MRPHVRYAGEWVPLVGPAKWVPKSVTFEDTPKVVVSWEEQE